MGGMYAIPQALARLLEELGGEVRMGRTVTEVMPSLSRCNGQKDKMVGATQSHAFYYLRNGNCD